MYTYKYVIYRHLLTMKYKLNLITHLLCTHFLYINAGLVNEYTNHKSLLPSLLHCG